MMLELTNGSDFHLNLFQHPNPIASSMDDLEKLEVVVGPGENLDRFATYLISYIVVSLVHRNQSC